MLKKIVCVLALLLSLISVQAAERFIEKTFDVESGVRISLDHYKGEIKIRTGSSQTVQVSARVYLTEEDARYSEEECKKLVDAMEVQFRNGKQNVSIEVDGSATGKMFSGLFTKSSTQPFVDIDMVIPDDASLDLDSYKGTFDIVCPSRRIIFETYKGRGSISGVRSDLSIDTYKGNLDIDIEQMGNLEVETYKGEVVIDIQGATDFTIHGDTHKGQLQIDGVEASKTINDDETVLYLKEGSGANRVELDTYKGTIRLNFL